MKNYTPNQKNLCLSDSWERWTPRPLVKSTLYLGSAAEHALAKRSLRRAHFCSSQTSSPPWISQRRRIKLGSRSLPQLSIPSRSSSRSMVHDIFIGERHLPAFPLGMLYPSSINYNTDPKRRNRLLNKRTSSSTANLAERSSTYLCTHLHPHPSTFYCTPA